MAFGQGQVNFSATANTISANSALGGALTGKIPGTAGSFYFELLVAPNGSVAGGTTYGANSPTGFVPVDPTTNGQGWVDTSYTAANTATAGRFALEPSEADSSGYADLTAVSSAYSAGASADLMIVGWSANLGSTWSAIKGEIDSGQYSGTGTVGWIGESEVGASIVLGGGASPIPQVPSAQAGIAGFGLYEVQIPEPATFALCGLGAAALVIFRRRS